MSKMLKSSYLNKNLNLYKKRLENQVFHVFSRASVFDDA